MFQFESIGLVDGHGTNRTRLSDLVTVSSQQNGSTIEIESVTFDNDQYASGTATAAGLFDEDGRLLLTAPFPTPLQLHGTETVTVEDIQVELEMLNSEKVEPIDTESAIPLDDDDGFTAELH